MNDMATPSCEPTAEFLASHGGPFYELQLRMHLLHDHALMIGRRSAIFIALAWGGPFILGLPQSLSLKSVTGLPYLLDVGAWAKFVVAIGAFMLAEQQIELRLRETLRQVMSAPLIAPESLADGAVAINTALKRRNSPIAEGLCLALSILAVCIALRHQFITDISSWAVVVTGGRSTITPAGWWAIFVSVPLFWFLALRGLWRHLVWSLLLCKVAHLRLRLVSTHPDGRGGIGFLADYPNGYMLFIFGISCAVAAAIGKNLLHEVASMKNVTILTTGWLLTVLALFALPLSAFSKPLTELKKASMARLSAQATQFQRSTERKLTGNNVFADSQTEAEQAPEVADPSKQFDATKKQSTFLFNHTALLPVSAAALIPFGALASTRVPFMDVLELLKKLLLL